MCVFNFSYVVNSILKKMNGGTPKDTKLIILTSSIYPEDRNKAMEISKDIIFLNKPLTPEMLDSI